MTDHTVSQAGADTAEVERLRAEVADLRENPRDEYHTMRELYDYRMLYNAHASHGWLAAGIPVVKSWRHSDGEECFGGGWFIVTATLPTGQVSNHYEAERWDLFRVPEVDLPPAYDGHTPADAADRLLSALYAYQGGPYLAATPEDADTATICPYRFPLPYWAGEDQMDRQRCALPSGHAREHATTPPVAATSEEGDRG